MRAADLGLETEQKKHYRKNRLVEQRAEGEPSHSAVKATLLVLALCAIVGGGYFAYTQFGSGDPEENGDPNPKGGAETGGGKGIGATAGGTKPPVVPEKPLPPIDPATSSEIENELAFLRGRNELTSLADIAINQGNRESYEEILKAIDDPEKSRLADAAKAEALRVQQFYFQSNRPQNYRIPAKEIFRDPGIGTERDLTTYQKIALLQDQRQDWRTRTKAAFILAGSRDLDAADALVKAIQTDPDLNVVKEAHTTFEQNWGYRGDLFDVPPLVEWWQQNRPGSTSG